MLELNQEAGEEQSKIQMQEAQSMKALADEGARVLKEREKSLLIKQEETKR